MTTSSNMVNELSSVREPTNDEYYDNIIEYYLAAVNENADTHKNEETMQHYVTINEREKHDEAIKYYLSVLKEDEDKERYDAMIRDCLLSIENDNLP